jgi:hypothetical protein
MINRRGLITGLISLAAAPAIVRIESLMPVKVMKADFKIYPYQRKLLYWIESNPENYLNSFQRLWFNSQMGKFVSEPIDYEDFYK